MKSKGVRVTAWMSLWLGLALFTMAPFCVAAETKSAEAGKPAAAEPAAGPVMDLTIACDDGCTVYVNGKKIGDAYGHTETTTFKGIKLNRGKGNVIAVKAENGQFEAGLIAEIVIDGKRQGTSTAWKCTAQEHKNWMQPEFDDKDWKPATSYGKHGADPWAMVEGMPAATTAQWIWVSEVKEDQTVFFRYTLKD